jgi:hypothetical protein
MARTAGNAGRQGLKRHSSRQERVRERERERVDCEPSSV